MNCLTTQVVNLLYFPVQNFLHFSVCLYSRVTVGTAVTRLGGCLLRSYQHLYFCLFESVRLPETLTSPDTALTKNRVRKPSM